MKKRLLKDLPLSAINKGTVLTRANGGYHIDFGNTIYREGGESSNGWQVLAENESAIVDMIWESDWFEDANVKHLDCEVKKAQIIISFPSLDMADAQLLAKVIQACLIHNFGTEPQTMARHKFKGFTVSIH